MGCLIRYVKITEWKAFSDSAFLLHSKRKCDKIVSGKDELVCYNPR